jgi:hypothetical protein
VRSWLVVARVLPSGL